MLKMTRCQICGRPISETEAEMAGHYIEDCGRVVCLDCLNEGGLLHGRDFADLKKRLAVYEDQDANDVYSPSMRHWAYHNENHLTDWT